MPHLLLPLEPPRARTCSSAPTAAHARAPLTRPHSPDASPVATRLPRLRCCFTCAPAALTVCPITTALLVRPRPGRRSLQPAPSRDPRRPVLRPRRPPSPGFYLAGAASSSDRPTVGAASSSSSPPDYTPSSPSSLASSPSSSSTPLPFPLHRTVRPPASSSLSIASPSRPPHSRHPPRTATPVLRPPPSVHVPDRPARAGRTLLPHDALTATPAPAIAPRPCSSRCNYLRPLLVALLLLMSHLLLPLEPPRARTCSSAPTAAHDRAPPTRPHSPAASPVAARLPRPRYCFTLAPAALTARPITTALLMRPRPGCRSLQPAPSRDPRRPLL
nr:putative uncharacterized protein ENSP00000383309 [Aegilops tauschii subsp. strangulata]